MNRLKYIGDFDTLSLNQVGVACERVTMEEVVDGLNIAPIWALDTETYAKGFNHDLHRTKFLAEKSKVKKKLTKTDGKSADTHAEKMRSKIVFDPKKTTIRLLQIKAGKCVYIIDTFFADITPIMEMIPRKKIIGQNLKYDLSIIYYNWKVEPLEVFDTMIANRIIGVRHTGQRFSSKFGDIVEKYMDIKLDKSFGAEDWGKEISSEMLLYAFYDVEYLPSLRHKMTLDLNYEPRFYANTAYFDTLYDKISQLEMRFVMPLIRVELYGITINEPELKKVYLELQPEIEKAMKLCTDEDVNPNSPSQVKDYFTLKGIHIPDTTKNTLLGMEHPMAKTILHAKNITTKASDIKSYLEVAEDGRVYPSFNAISARSGRMSSFKPNVQKLPRSIKDIFYYDSPNRKIIKADYSAIEVRVIAEISKDDTMIKAFKDNLDIYKYTSSLMSGKELSEVTKEERQQAKALVLGLNFGMGAIKFKEYAYYNFGVSMTLEEAQEFRHKYLTVYSGIKQLHDINSMLLNMSNGILSHTILGRAFYVDRFTDANNFATQGSSADIFKLAVVIFDNKAKNIDAHIVNLIHDEIVVDSHKDCIEEASIMLKESMETAVNFVVRSFITNVEIE